MESEAKNAYPIILRDVGDGYCVFIPDFDIETQKDSIAEAMEMGRDASGIMGFGMEDDGKADPEPNRAKIEPEKGDIVTLVDIDFTEYRKKWIIVP